MKFPVMLAVMVLLQVVSISEGVTSDGIDLLNDFLRNDPKSFCYYVTCHENVAPENCPDGTQYREGVSQFGCCGACVRFKQLGESGCTGSIDPKYGGGYADSNNVLGHVKTASDNALSSSLYHPTNSSMPDGRRSLHNIDSASILGGLIRPNGNTVYSSWCDFYLVCGTRGCEINPNDRGCKYVQTIYDQDIADPSKYVDYRDDYRWRPDCTPDGEYVGKQCKGPTNEKRCVCVDPDGNRLYGSAFEYQTDLYSNMNCKCSKEVWERTQAGESTVTLHCAENGNYERLQCEEGWCYCMDPDTATPYGTSLPESALDRLPCYNRTLIGAQYLRRCEAEFHAHYSLVDLMEYKGTQGPSTRLTCDPDGSYSAKQCDNTMCRCYSKYNDEQLMAPAGDGCQCARDRKMFEEDQIAYSITCDHSSGTYQPIQPVGATVYCVDVDGIRNGPLVFSEYEGHLDCLSAVLCQNGGTNCEMTCTDCPEEAYFKYKP